MEYALKVQEGDKLEITNMKIVYIPQSLIECINK